MKTQVIQLVEHDDLISIRDRMAWAKTPRILLVWPRHGSVGVSPLDLTLLRRHAATLGAELGLVTRKREIRAAARKLGLSVFSRTLDAQKKPWHEKVPVRPQRRFPRADLRAMRTALPGAELFGFTSNPVRRVAVFAAGVLALLMLVLVFIPSAEISITRPEQKQTLVLPVSASPDVKDVQISGVVPARRMTLAVTASGTALATGSIFIPGQSAAGLVVFTNLTASSVIVPAGTILRTSSTPPVKFATTEKVDVPAGKGGTSSVQVRAAAAGIGGNIDSGQITAFDGPLGSKLIVKNPEAFSGGTQTRTAVATAADRDALRKSLLAGLERQALDQFSNQAGAGDVLFPDSLEQTRVLEEQFDPPEGETGASLALTLQVEYSLSYAAEADLSLLAQQVLNASIQNGFSPIKSTLETRQISPLESAQGVMRWQMQFERGVRPELDAAQVIALAQGLTVRAAAGRLTGFYGLVEAPRIVVHPGWWPWLPLLPFRIAVKS